MKQKEKCYLICSGRNGQQRVLCVSVLGGGMFVHSLNFKATFRVLRRRPCHCQYFTVVFAIVLTAVTISTLVSSCWLSPFHLFYFTVSRPCYLSESYTNMASRKVWYSGYQDFKLPCTTYIQLLDSGRLGEGPGGPGLSPTYFKTKLRPEGSKKIFLETGPYLRIWMTRPPPPLSEGMDPPLLKRGVKLNS